MRIHHLVIALALAAAATADAKPRRIAILDFDGPRSLADTGKAEVVSLLGDEYDIVSTRRWEQAKAAAAGKGPLQWAAAAKAAGVDALVEGWVDPDGMRSHTMTVAVRIAATGRQVDTVTAKLPVNGTLGQDAGDKLRRDIDALLAYADDDVTTGDEGLPIAEVQRPALGTHVAKPDPADESDGDDGDDDDDDDGSDRETHHHHRHHHHHHHHHDRDRDRDDDNDDGDRPARHAKNDDARDDDDTKDGQDGSDKPDDGDKKPSTLVAAADPLPGTTPGTANVIDIFGPSSKEVDVVLDKPSPALQRKSPRIELSMGTFLGERGMSFAQNPPDYAATPPSYPSSGFVGLQFQAAVFPRPLKKYGADLTGFGATFTLQKTLGAAIDAYSATDDTYGTYGLDYTGYEGALHYRYPLGIVMLDGQVSYGHQAWTLESDFPTDVQIPDTSYQFVGIGGSIELAITERTRVGFGAYYHYMLSVGDASDEDWYGSGSANGLTLNGMFKVPLGRLLYIKGIVEYSRVSMSFNGDGNLSSSEIDDGLAVSNIVDSVITGSAQLGVSF